jgi:hypothetical protein
MPVGDCPVGVSQVGARFPGALFVCVSNPFDQVLRSALGVDPFAVDSFHFVLLRVIDHNGKRLDIVSRSSVPTEVNDRDDVVDFGVLWESDSVGEWRQLFGYS